MCDDDDQKGSIDEKNSALQAACDTSIFDRACYAERMCIPYYWLLWVASNQLLAKATKQMKQFINQRRGSNRTRFRITPERGRSIVYHLRTVSEDSGSGAHNVTIAPVPNTTKNMTPTTVSNDHLASIPPSNITPVPNITKQTPPRRPRCSTIDCIELSMT